MTSYQYVKKASDREIQFIRNLVNFDPSDFEYLYFRNDNIVRVNRTLINAIGDKTLKNFGQRLVIQPQKKHILLTIMRGLYFFHARELNGSAEEKVKALNKLVLKEIFPSVYSGLMNRVKYINNYNNNNFGEILDNQIEDNQIEDN